MDRRNFLKKAAAVTAITSLNHKLSHASDNPVPHRTLGRSGEKVSIIGIGGYHLGPPSEQDAIRIVRTALDNGVNFLDNCWDYNDGVSEERMGKALRDGYRQKAFLMTKIDGQTRKAATDQLNESLRRLQTDHIDLLQFHEVIRESDPGRIFAAGGGMEAVLEAKNRAKSATSDSPATKVPTFTTKCCRPASPTTLLSTPSKCRSTSWTPITTASKRKCCRFSWSTKSECSA
jgi:hypothetical protein